MNSPLTYPQPDPQKKHSFPQAKTCLKAVENLFKTSGKAQVSHLQSTAFP